MFVVCLPTGYRYDSTGMFHWTPARPIEECIIVSSPDIILSLPLSLSIIIIIYRVQDKKEAAMTVLNGHVVVSAGAGAGVVRSGCSANTSHSAEIISSDRVCPGLPVC